MRPLHKNLVFPIGEKVDHTEPSSLLAATPLPPLSGGLFFHPLDGGFHNPYAVRFFPT